MMIDEEELNLNFFLELLLRLVRIPAFFFPFLFVFNLLFESSIENIGKLLQSTGMLSMSTMHCPDLFYP